ncbi:MAG: UDP-N-acetylmuramoyl-tripeptide--D-alanyl-D-alanine ligase [Ruminococcaceae bacterium]|nr:UDP-N-acetylmuramoyl-tripeptide--D-alanyl-D-alanine ligase [Oscillospiraceae bacterium]
MFSTKEIAQVTNGKLVGDDVSISSVSSDTRTIKKGALFIAINGERFDGNDFIKQAAAAGAAAAISDMPAGSVKTDIPVIYVGNSRTAQLMLARYYRSKFDIPLCGVTGSVGKTSTKDMIYAVLSAKFNTLKTEGNFNNEIGLPQTLFRLNEEMGAAVIEMGMSDRGEISMLSKTAMPDCCVITNIGYCHIEQLKTRENILAAKMEILDGATCIAPLIVCGDDEYLSKVNPDCRVVRYGMSAANDVYADNVRQSENAMEFTVHYKGKSYDARVPAVGEHHVLNALAAFAVGIEYGMTPEEIVPAFMNYEGSGLRQKIEKRGDVTVILDCYNASPTSMPSALKVLGSMKGHKVAVLGDMLELGEQSKALHAGLADVVSANAELIFLYGREMHALAAELSKRGVSVFHSENKEQLTKMLIENIKSGDVILFKGSRGMKMEEIADKIGGKS